MTILIAGFRYEANSFAPGRATLDAFRRGRLVVGDDALPRCDADRAGEVGGRPLFPFDDIQEPA